LTEITSYDDVWVVPISAGIEYMKDPKTNQQLIDGELPAFGCKNFPAPDCISPQNCKYVKNIHLILFIFARSENYLFDYCKVKIVSRNTMAQLHQHSMYSFYARRSQKHKKILMT